MCISDVSARLNVEIRSARGISAFSLIDLQTGAGVGLVGRQPLPSEPQTFTVSR